MNRRLPVQDAVSGGGVVWRRTASGELEVVLCGRRSDRVWSLPKGTPSEGETMEQTAAREVREETGLDVQLGAPLGSISYWFTAGGVRFHKQVHHWLMQAVGGDVANHDHEFDDVLWVPVAQARSMLTYRDERRVLDDAVQALERET
jgi:8-oxo-dGTP pyrophosphatase MutT (NUDIX family)